MPGLIFGFIIATMVGAGFHIWRGGGPGKLFFFLVLSWAGFAVGHFTAQLLGWSFLRVGALNMAMGVISALLFLLIGAWLGKPEESGIKKKATPRPMKR